MQITIMSNIKHTKVLTIVSIILASFLLCTSTYAQKENTSQLNSPLGSDINYHDLYLLIGQSNMAGRGVVGAEDKTINPSVFSLGYGDVWIPAKEPLHYDNSNRGTGPGLAFGKKMALKKPSSTIGLIPAAVGGTKISYWMPDNDEKGLYKEAIRKAKQAMHQGALKGILWQQGESDSYSMDDVSMYKARLITIINALRKDLGGENFPVVVGGLGNFLKGKYYKNINTILKEIADELPNVKFSEASTLGHIGDNLHFNAEAQRENGINMANAMLDIQQNYSSIDQTNMPEDIKIYSRNKTLYVETNPLDFFSIYEISGKLLAKHFGTGSFSLPSGFYLVQSNNKTTKTAN